MAQIFTPLPKAQSRRQALILRLPGADPLSPAPWSGLTALPFLSRLCREGAWLAWVGEGPNGPDPWNPARLGKALSRPELRAGLFNLPLPRPLPAGALFAVPEPGPGLAGRLRPRELALDLGDYLAGAVWTVGRPRPRPHERDLALAQQAAFARLAFEHADRLTRVHRPELVAVGLACPGLGGLTQVRALNKPESGRELMLLSQLDGYAEGLARAAGAEAVICLAGVKGALLWSPGLIRPGASGEAEPEMLPALIPLILGLEQADALHGTIPAGILDSF